MVFLKEWVLSVAAAIIFASLTEILLPPGNMKKYVSLTLGIILSITMIRPIEKISLNNWSYKMFEFERNNAYITQAELDNKEKKEVMDIYTNKLISIVNKKLSEKVSAKYFVDLKTETDKKEHFGEIKEVSVTVVQDENFKDYRSVIEEVLSTEFGVSKENIKVKFKSSV